MTEDLEGGGNPDATDRETVPTQSSTPALVARLLALIGMAAVVGTLYLLLQGESPSWAAAFASWSWALDVLLVVLAIAVILTIVRLVFRGIGARPRDRDHGRRARRNGRADVIPYRDPAVDIARTRYARGEITEDQLDRALGQLRKGA